jgi:multidrug efflux pump subunit AcrB
MPGFPIRNPFFIIVVCLVLLVIGIMSLVRMPADLFPLIDLPEVVVATFYSGMPPQDIESDITDPCERFFTLASGIDYMDSYSLLGVSIIRVYFQPATKNANIPADVRVNPRGMVAFKSFVLGSLLLSLLVYGKRNRQAVTAAPPETA